MSTETAALPGGNRFLPSGVAAWVRKRDPGLLTLKRSARAAVTMPTVFGLTYALFSNPQVSLFGAFGSFALLLLVDFPGRFRMRLISYMTLLLVGGCFIALGTVISTHKLVAVLVMAVVGFGVLFAGILSPQAATASTATLLIFVLPVAVAQPAAAAGPRLIGWAFAGAFCIPACMLLWPTPWHDDLRRRLSATMSAVARLATAHAQGGVDAESQATVKRELGQLRDQFRSTPYPPTGAAAGAAALAKLVGRIEWVAGNAMFVGGEIAAVKDPSVRKIIEMASETLRHSAALICDDHGHPVDGWEHAEALQESTRRLDLLMDTELDSEVSMLIDDAGVGGGRMAGDESAPGIASSLDPSFQARALGFAAEMVADAVLEASGAPGGGDRRLGGTSEAPSGLRRRLGTYLSFHSVWLRNAVRGGVGLALAVAVVEVTDIEHGFWVVLGTLSVLRSNALGTGATALRAVGGTAVGFVLGSAVMIGVSSHTVLLWILLPLAVLVSGVAPLMISFAAGQAAFTLVVIILFNIIEPTGWKVGLTRIEDVGIGCGVSIVVGILFWPRGAMAALGRALSDAFVTSSGYLADAVERLTSADHRVDTQPGQRASHRAYLRLDDAFRQFLAERGAKVVSVEVVANLFTGSNRIRLAAYTLSTLPVLVPEPGQPELDSVAIAGAVLRDSYAASHRWYEEFAEMLAGQRKSLDAFPVHDETLHSVLRNGFEDARTRRRGDRLRTMLQMLWADELLENQRQVQEDLARSADLFAKQRHEAFMI